jgi:hypothetical protein
MARRTGAAVSFGFPERTTLPEHVADARIQVLGKPASLTPRLRARSHLELSRYAATN